MKFADGLASVDSPTQFQEARAEMVNLYLEPPITTGFNFCRRFQRR